MQEPETVTSPIILQSEAKLKAFVAMFLACGGKGNGIRGTIATGGEQVLQTKTPCGDKADAYSL